MGGPGSGGRNRKSIEEHKRRGTYRPYRHAKPPPAPPAEILPLPTTPPDTSAGDKLVASVEAVFDMDPSEHTLLVQAGHTLDELHRIEDAIAKMAVVGLGSAKQAMSNPLLVEARQHRLLLQTLLRSLRIEEPAGQQTPLASVVQLSRYTKEHQR
jgi:hypothetical protein